MNDASKESLPLLMKAQCQREFELAHANLEHRIFLMRQALQGMSTNATNCGMCRMHNNIYQDVLARDDELAGKAL